MGSFATMIVAVCQHDNRKIHGKTKTGTTRYKCKDCGVTFTESTDLFCGMRIGLDRAAQIIELLCEGMAVRAVARITDTGKNTILRLMTLVGERCASFMEDEIREVHVDDVQVDEIWQYIYCKAATAEAKKLVGGCGDSYCYTAIERHTKLLICWHHGHRNTRDTHAFVRKLATATSGRFQLSADGWQPYPWAVNWNLGQRVDFGTVVKQYGSPSKMEQRRYSPAKIIGSKRKAVAGHPNPRNISTSHVERMNGSIRHFTKRMARLTCAFSKKWANHQAALGLFFAHYNFCRVHRSLRTTPAMAHGISTEVWTVKQLLQRISG